MRKNIFEVSEEEKKKILESHINATKNQYLILENVNKDDLYYVASYFKEAGIPLENTNRAEKNGDCWTVYIVDNTGYNNIWVDICKGGYFALKGRNWETEVFNGTWSLSDGYVIFNLNGSEIYKGKFIKEDNFFVQNDGKLRPIVVCWLLRQKSFYENWTSVQEWPWTLDDLIQISKSSCSNLSGELKKNLDNLEKETGGFLNRAGSLLPNWYKLITPTHYLM